jgi:hypothetical protein
MSNNNNNNNAAVTATTDFIIIKQLDDHKMFLQELKVGAEYDYQRIKELSKSRDDQIWQKTPA